MYPCSPLAKPLSSVDSDLQRHRNAGRGNVVSPPLRPEGPPFVVVYRFLPLAGGYFGTYASSQRSRLCAHQPAHFKRDSFLQRGRSIITSPYHPAGVRSIATVRSHISKFHQIFCTSYPWLRLCFPVTAIRYIMYFRFCGGRHVFI